MAAVLNRRVVWTVIIFLVSAIGANAQVRIVQTNSAGDNIHLIDPANNTIVGEIKGIPINHGAAALPDASRLFFSSEAEQTLHVVEGKTLQTMKKIPLTGRPNNISISKDGARVYVGIVSAPGAVDVIDTKTLEKVKSIPTKGGIHNVYVTPDGKHIIAGSIAGRVMTVIDQKTEEPLWTLFEEGVRPMAFEVNPDGSTKRIFVQLSNFHGFAIVDCGCSRGQQQRIVCFVAILETRARAGVRFRGIVQEHQLEAGTVAQMRSLAARIGFLPRELQALRLESSSVATG